MRQGKAKWPWYCTDLRLSMGLFALSLPTQSPLAPVRGFLATLTVAGCVLLVAFFLHSVRLVFNQKAPRPLSCARPLWHFFRMTRPLELAFRLLTAPLRDSPDLLILGEVRCGTTTLADHVKRYPGAAPPFCPWIHPLEDKESFYFAGHYFGIIHPQLYRAAFPLIVWRWLARLRGRPYFTFDAHAQVLTAPWGADRLRAAFRGGGGGGGFPEMLVCVREPVAQAVSWWRFEQTAMRWAAEQLGLRGASWRPRTTTAAAAAAAARTTIAPRRRDTKDGAGTPCGGRGGLLPPNPVSLPSYPPASLPAAFRGSLSDGVAALYDAAADELGPQPPPLSSSSPSAHFSVFLPYRFGTWPHGQLFAAARCGQYANNLKRYVRAFRGVGQTALGLPSVLTVIELDAELSRELDETLKRVGAAIERGMERRCVGQKARRGTAWSTDRSRRSLERIKTWRAAIAADERAKRHVANRSAHLKDSALEPDEACKRELAQFFRAENEHLFALIGRRFDHWHKKPCYCVSPN